ncbi:MAG: hypothetical protein QF444_00755 [Phycisphaerales bacterium]|jgi:hypothetical protein|nr:hypothetical protein [Phycisphaerales bacterium]MDP6692829.1 hypothetical protein [Phycisphaerales bacterium]
MAAPTKEHPFPTVVLQHEMPDGTTHFDWLLGVDEAGEKPLISFRADKRPDLLTTTEWIDLATRPDHRPDYLTYEGPLEDNRGVVKRLGVGSIQQWQQSMSGWKMVIEWEGGPIVPLEITTGSLVRVRVMPIKQEEITTGDIPVGGDLPIVDAEGPAGLTRKITAFGDNVKHEDSWSRVPNTTGTGAIHVRTFHSKLTDDALKYLDQQVNEWLDEHPQYEVKQVNTTIGTFTGKVKEPHVICQVWV